jgi:hypothetical protein
VVARLVQAKADVDGGKCRRRRNGCLGSGSERPAGVVAVLVQAKADADKAGASDGATPTCIAA